MTDVRVEETYDGLCTVTVGKSLVFTDLSRDEAETLAARYRRIA